MLGPEGYITDVWSSRLSYLKGLAKQAWDPSSVPRIPKGFPGTFTQVGWAQLLRNTFLSRIAQLRATGDDVDAIYAEHTEEALAFWERSGGMSLPSAFQQMTRALDALIREGAGIDAVFAMTEQIRRYLVGENEGKNIPFPNPPPTGSRERMTSWSPVQFARFLALGLVALPYANAVRQEAHIQHVSMEHSVLVRAARHAAVIETLAAHIMLQPAAQGTAPGSLGDFLAILDDTEKYLGTPDMASVPASVTQGVQYLREQLLAIMTPLDALMQFPDRVAEEIDQKIDETKDQVESGAMLVGSMLAAGILVAAAISRRGSTVIYSRLPSAPEQPPARPVRPDPTALRYGSTPDGDDTP